MNANKLRTLFKRGIGIVLKERLIRKGIYLVPRNLKYRPQAGVDVKGPSDDFESEVIESKVVCETFVPAEFHAAMIDKGYDHFDRSSDPYRMFSEPCDFLVARIPEGRLISDNLKVAAYITRGNRVLSEVSLQYVDGKGSVPVAQSPVFRQRYFKEPERIPGRVFAMLAGGLSGRGNYYHWMVDVLPRLHLLRESRFSEGVDAYIVPQYDRDFQKTTLEALGIGSERIVECGPQAHFRCDELIVSSHPRGTRSLLIPDWVMRFYDRFKPALLDDKDYGERIYITRKDTSLRGIVDEDRLIDFLAGYGFKPYTLAKHDLAAKASIFDRAQFIISPHGAGLTNLLFGREGGHLLELFTEGFVDPLFANLAERKGMSYDYLIFSHPRAAREDAKGQYEDITIDYDKLERKFSEIGL